MGTTAFSAGTKHGLSNSPEYNSWRGMKDRCLRPSHVHFKDYGGRGVKIAASWRSSFLNFLADMGRKPSPAHSIDRRDNDAGYFPGNCRWATAKQQAANRRPPRRATGDHDGD